ncbi:tyrosinase family oxidase copper chaperone [Streptomyces sp. NPDC020571]|uniref:tyrosinase family oxidase copper chaperone n=1 Tax=Streptomyces sp. NPDC020571 TaxID=3365079 RepID=UPI0037A13859
MVGNAGATAKGASGSGAPGSGAPGGGAGRKREQAAEDSARGGPVAGTRRQVMRGLLAPALAVGLAPLIAASRPSGAAEAATTGPRCAHPGPHTAEPAGGAEGVEGVAFDETYRGRRIRGIRSAAGRAVGAGTWQVTVDGRPLHLMRRADGTWLSMVDHYRSYPTPLEAARGAVDELGPGEHLRDTPSAGHDQHSGERHGVHA